MWAAIAFASVAAIALGADWGFGQARSAGARTAGAMAELARAANENGQYERAARFAIAGLRAHDTPLLGFAPNAAYAELARASLASRLTASTQMHVGGLTHPALSPDGRLFVTADLSYFLRLWDAGTGALVAPLHNHNSYLTTVVFSPDGRRVLSASYDGTVRVWDLSTGDVIVHLEDDMGVVYDAVFSSDGATILTASGDATARLWDAQTGREIRRFVGHRHELMSANSIARAPVS